MARTVRDISVYNKSVPEVMNEIMAWANAYKVKIEEQRGTYLKVRLPKSGTEWAASFVMETQKIIEITVQQAPNGIVVHTEGFVKPPMGKEEEFSATAVMAGVPKRAGWHAIEDLWRRLGSLSSGTAQQVPYTPQQPYPAPQAPPPPPQAYTPAYSTPKGMYPPPPPPPPPGYKQPQTQQPATYPPPPPEYPPPPPLLTQTKPPEAPPKSAPPTAETSPMSAKAEALRQETQAPTMKPKYCSSCGAFLGERTEKIKFCPNCGEKIG